MLTLRYHPVLGDAEDLVLRWCRRVFLVIGDGVPDAMTAAGATRLTPDGSDALPADGIYVFPTSEGTDLLLVTTGSTPCTSR